MPHNILIVRLSSIGDIILTTPVIRCLKQQLPPDTQIHYLTKPAFTNILNPNPYINKIHTLKNSITETITALQPHKFTFLLDLHNNLRTYILKTKLNIATATFNKLNIEKWLLTNLNINRLPNTHIVDRYLQPAIQHFNIQNDNIGLDYFIPPNEQINPQNLVPILKTTPNQQQPTPYIAIAISAAHTTKHLTIEKTIELCKKIAAPIILLGGKQDTNNGQHIANNAGQHVHSLCGKLTLHGSASIIKQAHKVITPDTGLMHIAAAFNKPTAVIWGNTIPAFGMYPYRSTNWQSFEVKNLTCRPCSKIGYPKCPKKHFNCINNISTTDIANWINQNP